MMDAAMNDSIGAQVAARPGLPMKELWALWDAHFPRRPARTSRHYVESRLAYWQQEQAYWPLPVGVRRYLVERGAQFSRIKPAGRGTEYHLMPGTVLVREWDGREYRITVTADSTNSTANASRACRRRRATLPARNGRGRSSSGSKRTSEANDEHRHLGLTQALRGLLPRLQRRTARLVLHAEGSRTPLHQEPDP